MFGSSMLVSPVTEKEAVQQSVYLPKGISWIDFWTGETIDGGKTVTKATPRDILPLYVKGGSIIPWGPKVQYAAEKKWDGLEIRIYPGADAEFILYEDEGDSYNYEKGLYAEIAFHWDDHLRKLTIDARKGSFPGMLNSRKFNGVIVNEQNGIGSGNASKFNKRVIYSGRSAVVSL